jgi:hypothetical protein
LIGQVIDRSWRAREPQPMELMAPKLIELSNLRTA